MYAALSGGLGAHNAAVGLHDVHAGRHADILALVVQMLDIVLDLGHQIGVDGRGAEPFVFFDLGQGFGGGAKVDALHLPHHELLHFQLVGAIDVRIQEADGHGFYAVLLHLLDDVPCVFFLYIFDDGTIGQGALIDLKHQIAGNGRLRALDPEIVQVWALLPPNLQHIPEPLCGDQGGLGALSLQQRVGGDGGAMDKVANLPDRDLVGNGNLLDARLNADGVILRGGGHFGHIGFFCFVIKYHDISEGTTYINTQFIAHSSLPPGYMTFSVCYIPYSSAGSHSDRAGTKETSSKTGSAPSSRKGIRGFIISLTDTSQILEQDSRQVAMGGVIAPMPMATNTMTANWMVDTPTDEVTGASIGTTVKMMTLPSMKNPRINSKRSISRMIRILLSVKLRTSSENISGT